MRPLHAQAYEQAPVGSDHRAGDRCYARKVQPRLHISAMRAWTQWVLLCYRLPREPSTPRIAVWRKLKRLGVAQLGDGLVALPSTAVPVSTSTGSPTRSPMREVRRRSGWRRPLDAPGARPRAADGHGAGGRVRGDRRDAAAARAMRRALRAAAAAARRVRAGPRAGLLPARRARAARAALDDLATATRAEVAT